jgi:hypothetical protein
MLQWSLLKLSATSGVCIEHDDDDDDDDDDDNDQDGPQNVGSIQTPDMADSPRSLHWI